VLPHRPDLLVTEASAVSLPVYPGDDTCFGCGEANPAGLQMAFRRVAPHVVESEFAVPAHLCGAPTVVHGGIQATILDEVIGKAAHTAFSPDDPRRVVTVEFSLRYRRPAPIATPIIARAEMVRVDGADVFLRGELLGSDGTVFTTAEARWKAIGPA
jgi:acyl-coenzyme A thioesterase PaaI-like protein